jgi:Radial spokehead-like protein
VTERQLERMEVQNLDRIGELNGNCLSIEEISGLQVAMMQRKLEENLPGKMYFWGKIFGSTQDYLVVHNTDPYAVFPEKKFYFWYVVRMYYSLMKMESILT